MSFVDFLQLVYNAKTLEALDSVEEKLENASLGSREKTVARQALALQQALQQALTSKQRTNGVFFTDALEMWNINHEQLPGQNDLMKSFNKICRIETPEYYNHIVSAASQKNKDKKLYEPNLDTLGTNSRYPKFQNDIFNNPIDNSKARLFLDSKTCAPAWGLMAEGATGKIVDERLDDQDKNTIRLVRMMGSCKPELKKDCLRYDVHNYIPIASSHGLYFDGEPQLLILPILGLNEIKEWDGVSGYNALAVVASKKKEREVPAATVYRHILSNYDWDKFDENPAICERDEIELALASLCEFVRALAHTLVCNIPQTLLKSATVKDDVNQKSKNKKKVTPTGRKTGNSKSGTKKKGHNLPRVSEQGQMEPTGDDNASKNERLWWDYEPLLDMFNSKGVGLPSLKEGDVGRVLKVRFESYECDDTGSLPVPDPWLLMVKAAVNYSFIAYGRKLLPVCKPPPHESVLQYEEALRRYEQLARQKDIPMELSVPATPSSVVTPPDKVREIEEGNSWEYFAD